MSRAQAGHGVAGPETAPRHSGPPALHDRLAADGVVIVTVPCDGLFGRTLAFADPDT